MNINNYVEYRYVGTSIDTILSRVAVSDVYTTPSVNSTSQNWRSRHFHIRLLYENIIDDNDVEETGTPATNGRLSLIHI